MGLAGAFRLAGALPGGRAAPGAVSNPSLHGHGDVVADGSVRNDSVTPRTSVLIDVHLRCHTWRSLEVSETFARKVSAAEVGLRCHRHDVRPAWIISLATPW